MMATRLDFGFVIILVNFAHITFKEICKYFVGNSHPSLKALLYQAFGCYLRAWVFVFTKS